MSQCSALYTKGRWAGTRCKQDAQQDGLCGNHYHLNLSQNLGFHLGNVVKYIARSSHKGHAIEDLKKAECYLQRAIERMK